MVPHTKRSRSTWASYRVTWRHCRTHIVHHFHSVSSLHSATSIHPSMRTCSNIAAREARMKTSALSFTADSRFVSASGSSSFRLLTHRRMYGGSVYTGSENDMPSRSYPSYTFRTSFDCSQATNWFPGHMKKAMQQLEEMRIKQAHVIVELRDARIPFSSVNPDLDFLLKGTNKPRFVVLNKEDLAFPQSDCGIEKRNKRIKRKVRDKIRSSTQNCANVMYTSLNALGHSSNTGIDALIEQISLELPNRFKTTPRVILVVGTPNCGKSSLINTMRRISFSQASKYGSSTKVAGVAATPAFTREFSAFPISKDPPVYILDSPGIMLPRFVGNQGAESALRLALCGAIREEVADPQTVSDYLLYLMNKKGRFDYTEHMKTRRVSDNIVEVLESIDAKIAGRGGKGKNRDKTTANIHNSSRFLLRKFREGSLGQFMLDEDYLDGDAPAANVKLNTSLFGSERSILNE